MSTECCITSPSATRERMLLVLACAFFVLPLLIRASEDMEITVEMEYTWESHISLRTNHSHAAALCVVGSDGWFISGDFAKNATMQYWLAGTNVIEHGVTTSGMYLEQAKDFVSQRVLQQKPQTVSAALGYPNPGESFTHMYASPHFDGVAAVVWLAFCSGDYLKQPKRQIPMLLGPGSKAFGYSDKTVTFAGPNGLPKTVELFATNNALVCRYEVLRTTNFVGQTIPTLFHVVQFGPTAKGLAIPGSTTDLLGRVTSLRLGNRPEIPAEARKNLKSLGP